MRAVRLTCCCLGLAAHACFTLSVIPARAAGDEVRPAPLGTRVTDFTLKDATTGNAWSLHDCRVNKAVVVLFLGTACPVNNAYAPTLADLHKKYAPQGVQFVAINSTQQDAAADVAKHAKEFRLPFPVLKD